MPLDGLPWRMAHDAELQHARRSRIIGCGPGGTIHDYVPFYFGARSPMLLKLKTGGVAGYDEGQEPLVYLVSTAQAVSDSKLRFVFTDGHAFAAFSSQFDCLDSLGEVDWDAVQCRYWGSNNDPTGELQRKKQAEFLVHGFVPWTLIRELVVIDDERRRQVEAVLAGFDVETPVRINCAWYY